MQVSELACMPGKTRTDEYTGRTAGSFRKQDYEAGGTDGQKRAGDQTPFRPGPAQLERRHFDPGTGCQHERFGGFYGGPVRTDGQLA